MGEWGEIFSDRTFHLPYKLIDLDLGKGERVRVSLALLLPFTSTQLIRSAT